MNLQSFLASPKEITFVRLLKSTMSYFPLMPLLPVLKILVCSGRALNARPPAHKADALTARPVAVLLY